MFLFDQPRLPLLFAIFFFVLLCPITIFYGEEEFSASNVLQVSAASSGSRRCKNCRQALEEIKNRYNDRLSKTGFQIVVDDLVNDQHLPAVTAAQVDAAFEQHCTKVGYKHPDTGVWTDGDHLSAGRTKSALDQLFAGSKLCRSCRQQK